MDGVAGAALAGVIAGAAVALPLGAIGVLLVQEAITAGWRPAAAGAAGVGLVDTAYATVAVLAGATVTRAVNGHQQAVRLVGAVLLTAVAANGLVGVWRATRSANRAPEASQAREVNLVHDVPSQLLVIRRPALRVAARFVTLTAVNPMTAIYFVALAAGSTSAISGFGRSAAFVAGVFVASLTWQLALVTMGWLAGSRLGIRARMATGLLGNLIVLGYAARMAASAG